VEKLARITCADAKAFDFRGCFDYFLSAMRYVLFWFFFCLSLGVGINLLFPQNALWYLGAGSVSLFGAAVFGRRMRPFFIFIITASVSLGGFCHAGSVRGAHAAAWEKWVRLLDGREVRLEGTVCRDLKQYTNSWEKCSTGFVMNRLRLCGAGGRPLPGAVKTVLSGEAAKPVYGQRLRVSGQIKPFRRARNPAEFDKRHFMRMRGCYAILCGQTYEPAGYARGAGGLLFFLRNYLLKTTDRYLGREEAGIAKAIVLGERSGLDYGFKGALAATGTMHLFAISGLHVALVGGLVHWVLCFLRCPARRSAFLLALFLIVYCRLTGADPPVVRATIMACIVLGARVFRLRSSGLNSLGAAGACILFLNPDQLMDVGFQLSFAAVLGLVVFMPVFSSVQDIRDTRSDKWWYRLRPWISMSLAGSTIAWVVTGPLVIRSFGRVFLLAPLLNLILVPVVFTLIAVLLAFLLLSPLPLPWGVIAGEPVSALTKVLTGCVSGAEGCPAFSFFSPPWPFAILAVFLCALAWIGLTRRIRRRWIRLAAMALLFLNALLAVPVAAGCWAEPYRITFFDVGQGDCALFEFPGGGTLLSDTGPGGSAASARRVIIPYLRRRGISRIDAVVISHPQFDHCGALETLVDNIEIGLVADNGTVNPGVFHRRVLEKMKNKGIRRERVCRGDRLEGLPLTRAVVLNPSEYKSGVGGSNNQSVVLWVSHGGFDVLLTGDLEKSGLEDILNTSLPEEVDILKTPHHGAAMGMSGLALLRRVRPKVSVISVGESNRYGHPELDTLEVLMAFSNQVYRTDRDGAVQIRVYSGGDAEVQTWNPEGN